MIKLRSTEEVEVGVNHVSECSSLLPRADKSVL